MSRQRKQKDRSSGEAKHQHRGHTGRSAHVQLNWYETHGRDLRFLLIFAVLMVLYYLVTTTHLMEQRFFPWYLNATANVSGRILHLGGSGVKIDGKSLDDPDNQGSVTVERGCDAVASTALFVSAVIASPAPWASKIPAILGGTFILMVVNIIRIVTLYLTRIYWTRAFDVMHLDVWQAAFIFLAIMLWAFWAAWTTKRLKRRSDAST